MPRKQHVGQSVGLNFVRGWAGKILSKTGWQNFVKNWLAKFCQKLTGKILSKTDWQNFVKNLGGEISPTSLLSVLCTLHYPLPGQEETVYKLYQYKGSYDVRIK